MRLQSPERGFTLIELMIAVAIVAVLAIIVVPTFTREARKAKGSTEVNAMFAQLATKEELYKNELGGYLDAPQCPGTVPTPSAGYNFSTTCVTSGSNWEKLRIQPPESTMRCAYTLEAKPKGETLTPPSGFKNSQGALNTAEPTLAGGWWYALAECDQDGQGGTNSMYYMSSVDPTIQVRNAGS